MKTLLYIILMIPMATVITLLFISWSSFVLSSIFFNALSLLCKWMAHQIAQIVDWLNGL